MVLIRQVIGSSTGLASYFNTVHHCLLLICERTHQGQSFPFSPLGTLKAGHMAVSEGVLQSSVFSPLLLNNMLDEFDKWL